MKLRALILLLAASTSAASAQDSIRVDITRPTPRMMLSLQEAITRARVNSPTYRQALNDAGPAKWAVRNALGQFIPSLQVSSGFNYTGAGSATFGGTTFNQSSPALGSSYGISMGLTIDGTVLTAPATEKANQRAVGEDISAAGVQLANDVTFQYLSVLESVARTEVARQDILRNDAFLTLARARQQLGQATLLDVRQAEVTRGQSEVLFLQSLQAENEAKLELFRRMGVPLDIPVTEVALSDSFPVTAPDFDLAALLRMAESDNPTIRAARAREDAAGTSVAAAKSEYLPSLNFSAGWNGFTQEFTNSGLLVDRATGQAIGTLNNCEFQNALIGALPGGGIPGQDNGGIVPDCKTFAGLDATGTALSPDIAGSILASNNQFPFNYNAQPFRASVSVSLPIFVGFRRNLQVARASAAREDASERTRAANLFVQADVQGRYLALHTAYQTIAVQEANRTAANEQLTLAQERFRLGNGSSLEVSDAQVAVSRAEGDYVNALYAYHKAIAALEFAVGRPLR